MFGCYVETCGKKTTRRAYRSVSVVNIAVAGPACRNVTAISGHRVSSSAGFDDHRISTPSFRSHRRVLVCVADETPLYKDSDE